MQPFIITLACVVSMQRHPQWQRRGLLPYMMSLMLRYACWLNKRYTRVQCIRALRLGNVADISHIISLADEVAIICVLAAIPGRAAALAQAKDAWGGGRRFQRNVGRARRTGTGSFFVWCWWAGGVEWEFGAEWCKGEIVEVGVGAPRARCGGGA